MVLVRRVLRSCRGNTAGELRKKLATLSNVINVESPIAVVNIFIIIGIGSIFAPRKSSEECSIDD